MTDDHYVLTVCLDGLPEERDYHAIEETIEAGGEAICRHEEEPSKIVTLLLSRTDEDYRAGQAPRILTAEQAAYVLFGEQLYDRDFNPRTASFASGADVCAALASHFNLTDDEYRNIGRRKKGER